MHPATRVLPDPPYGYLARRHFVLKDSDVIAAEERGYRKASGELSVEFQPWSSINEKWFSTEILVGYQYQVLFRGFPIGEPSVVPLHFEKKCNDQRIKELLGLVDVAVSATCKRLEGNNIAVRRSG
jgi:hypothetical protein